MNNWKTYSELTPSQQLMEKLYPSQTKTVNGKKYFLINERNI